MHKSVNDRLKKRDENTFNNIFKSTDEIMLSQAVDCALLRIIIWKPILSYYLFAT